MDDGGRVRLWLRRVTERFRSSLFGVPLLWILGAVVVSSALVELDRRLGDADLPEVLDATAGSSRGLLTAIATGMIAAASVVFSLTLVALQLSSSAYSPRVLRTFLRDRVQQHVIGLVTGTFTYSLLVLREISTPADGTAEAFDPHISVSVATVLAVVSLVALIASINHTAQMMRVDNVTAELVAETRAAIIERLPEEPDTRGDTVAVQAPGEVPSRVDSEQATAAPDPDGMGAVVTATRSGWVQQLSVEALRQGMDTGSTVRLSVAVGSYVAVGTPLLTVWPVPTDDDALQQAEKLRGAVVIGGERTLQHDVAFGLVMLEDIALRALSPGVNDPNTATAVLPQLTELLLEILCRRPAPTRLAVGGSEILQPSELTHGDFVRVALDQIRRAAQSQPAVLESLVRTVRDLGDELIRRRRHTPDALDALRHQLRAVATQLPRSTLSDDDRTGLIDLVESVEWYPESR